MWLQGTGHPEAPRGPQRDLGTVWERGCVTSHSHVVSGHRLVAGALPWQGWQLLFRVKRDGHPKGSDSRQSALARASQDTG